MTLTPREKLDLRLNKLPANRLVTVVIVTDSNGKVVEYGVMQEVKAEARGFEEPQNLLAGVA